MTSFVHSALYATTLSLALGLLLGRMAGSFTPVNPRGLPQNFRRRVLAMEFARNEADVQQIVGQDEGNIRLMRRIQYVDFAFILTYVVAYVSVAMLIFTSGVPFARAIAIAAGACGIAAGICDVLEDLRILGALQPAAAFHSPAPFAFSKWGLTFVFLILITPLFFRSGPLQAPLVLLYVTGALLAVAGLVGLTALLGVYRRIETATAIMSVALLLVLVSLIWTVLRPGGAAGHGA